MHTLVGIWFFPAPEETPRNAAAVASGNKSLSSEFLRPVKKTKFRNSWCMIFLITRRPPTNPDEYVGHLSNHYQVYIHIYVQYRIPGNTQD